MPVVGSRPDEVLRRDLLRPTFAVVGDKTRVAARIRPAYPAGSGTCCFALITPFFKGISGFPGVRTAYDLANSAYRLHAGSVLEVPCPY